MSAASHLWKTVSEGLIFGFTFALGWLAAVMVVGLFVA